MISLVMFDLGGVLAGLGDPVRQMSLDMSETEFWTTWLSSPTLHALETGTIDDDEFLAIFPSQLGLSDSPSEFRQRLQRWWLPLHPGVDALLDHLGSRRQLALLSNTNVFHWPMVSAQSSSFHRFDHVFLSYEIGLCKPDPRVFKYVLANVPAPAHEILFLDDNEANVEAARENGIAAVCVTGMDDVAGALAANGIEPDSPP